MELENIISACRNNGDHFFDEHTMKYWGTKLESSLIEDQYFITSELDIDGERKYVPRMALLLKPAYTIRAIGSWCDTYDQAFEAITNHVKENRIV